MSSSTPSTNGICMHRTCQHSAAQHGAAYGSVCIHACIAVQDKPCLQTLAGEPAELTQHKQPLCAVLFPRPPATSPRPATGHPPPSGLAQPLMGSLLEPLGTLLMCCVTLCDFTSCDVKATWCLRHNHLLAVDEHLSIYIVAAQWPL